MVTEVREDRSHIGRGVVASFDWTSPPKDASLATLDEGGVMIEDQRELANHLFATATAMIEDMAEAAVAGQSPRLSSSQLADHGRSLKAAARDVAIIVEAATIVARSSIDRPHD